MGSQGRSNGVRFGSFQLDLRARELRRNGIRVRVPDQSIQILAMLLEHPGEVVTRQDVHQKLWPNGTIVEFDASINAAVKRLRQALEDSAEAPRYIETLPRVGYRFIGPVGQALAAPPTEISEAKLGEREGEVVLHYRILQKIGAGGMGIVYKAVDTRLGRTVALKFLSDEFAGNEAALDRFRREARAASALNHANICTLYDIGRISARPFLVMEFLEGQTLLQLIRAGPLATNRIFDLGLQILDALDTAHAKGIVHRDIKPSNILVTTRGSAKITDFGLAKIAPGEGDFLTTYGPEKARTADGAPVGTVAYMSPEQARGERLDARTDLFSFGVVLYEMATGLHPFQGQTNAVTFDAILNKSPIPPVEHRPDLPPDLELIIGKALAKDRNLRWQTACELSAELRRVQRVIASDSRAPVPKLSRPRVMSRLIVLPFRILRPNPETDFLAFSLPDAITSSLSGLDSLIVRSSFAAARFAGDTLNLKTIAEDADVDAVLTGTLLTSGSHLRVSAQLMETPSGAVIWSKTSQVPLRDIFQLQDDLVHSIVESLSLPLTVREHRRLKHDVPASPTAYEYYLRGNLLYHDWPKMSVARDLYLRSVEEDPQYAPAWARLGRCLRLIAKWSGESDASLTRAKDALERAIQLSPDLPLAHHLYAQLEADLGRAQNAMVRLLGRAELSSNDPELFAGLTQVCRYCGLLDASLAAHEQARGLDPQARTSVAHTHFMLGDYTAAAANSLGGDHLGVLPLALSHLGHQREAVEVLRKNLREELPLPVIRCIGTSILALLEGRNEDSVLEAEAFIRSCRDPESFYYFARQFAFMGSHARAVQLLNEAVKRGYVCFSTMTRDPWLDPLRGNPEFAVVRREAETRYREATQAFLAAGGHKMLGLRPV